MPSAPDTAAAGERIQHRRFRIIDILAAVSLAHVCFLTVWRELLFASDADRYWIPDYSAATYVAVILNVAVFSLVIWACIAFLVRAPWRGLNVLGAVLILAILVFPLNYLRMAVGVNENTVIYVKEHWPIFAPLGVMLAAAGAYLVIFRVRLLTKAILLLCLILSPFAVLDLAQAAWLAVSVKPAAAQENRVQQAARSPAPPRRVVWLLMDELDLRLAFQERPVGLELPEFDRLRRQAFFAWNGKSYSRNTEEAIPSFLIQKIVKRAAPQGPRDLQLTFDPIEADEDANFSDFPNLFSQAAQAGARIAVIGLYHPYCRLFAEHVTYCRQFSLNTYTPTTSRSVFQEASRQVMGITPLSKRINGVVTFTEMRDAILGVVGNPEYDLVYVHASVPHGPNIWNDHRKAFTLINTSRDGYFDNLKLADHLLGDIRREMERQNLWDSSTILLTSDHEWRHVYLFDNQRIRKIPFVLKMAGQQDAVDFKAPFAPMRLTKDLLLQIHAGQISTPSDVGAWITARAVEAQ